MVFRNLKFSFLVTFFMNFGERVFITRTGKRSKVWMHDVRVCQAKTINGILYSTAYLCFCVCVQDAFKSCVYADNIT